MSKAIIALILGQVEAAGEALATKEMSGLVASGKITQAQADAFNAALATFLTDANPVITALVG